ncbi:hypothetical protein HJA87_29115 [Rhizobium bangladeshense]|uniref:RiboL-PSP-HEPN domain-containing protein n=1 Tax=Rhizobium bangladeshense TaxID=1138189 RepID=A0ABS7LR74_9HYPH|nr:hypothetical protein [Rhizobium bangladeshense]MBX4876593.1 hypothetical protein [Rhizobium bangladeshense]MBX4887433.1 hypothetical protein [Rhizobium bangladeshense]MBY3593910.1 hypothetical protein [Rhizobium bangladeshense]MBY3599793.1 hypothetical protein [Rhizobium bangladeshense]
MSKLTDTKKAYDVISKVIDQEIRKRTSSAKDLQRSREVLDVAFYLLGWGQFEYLVRKETESAVLENAKAKGRERHAWLFLKENVKSMTVRQRLEFLFDGKPDLLAKLKKTYDCWFPRGNQQYDVRNEAAHDNKGLPVDVLDLSSWLEDLEERIDDL